MWCSVQKKFQILGFCSGLILLSVIPLNVLFSATTDFIVQTLVGSDTTPPTVPSGVTATGITTTQIDVAWTASTDDFVFSGYRVYRDDVQIATTTATSYSDTGLIASTSYAYYITAFDSFMNVSASSSVATGTTLSPPPPTATTTEESGSTFGFRIRALSSELDALSIIPHQESVDIRYTTEGHIRSVLRWGRTSSYELGSLVERSFSTGHETTISGLTPGTLYYFSIEGENKIERYGTMRSGTFMTLPPVDTFPPSNVRNLTAVREGNDIRLTWDNPADTDFEKVRIVRSNLFYPTDTRDGWVTYEGDGEEVLDAGALVDVKKQYYTVFTYDALGNISSGAVVAVSITGETGVIDDVDPTLNPIKLTFDALQFYQDGIRVEGKRGVVSIDGAKHLTISLPYESVPEHLKTILVVLKDSAQTDKKFSFLLRVNGDKTAYTSILAPLGVSGEFPIQVSVFDFVTTQVGYTEGVLSSKIQSTYEGQSTQSFIEWLMHAVRTFVSSYLFWFIILLVTLLFVSRRLMHMKW